MSLKQMSRFRAAAIHLMISAFIAAAVIALMLAVWYPPSLFDAMGGKKLLVLIIGIDVAVGPLITLIIFDTRKKELAFDLAVIAALQFTALSYGIYAMHSGRPVFVVFTEDRFVVVSAAEVDEETLSQAPAEFRTLPENGPIVVAADMPGDMRQRMILFFTGLSGIGVQNLPKYYVSYEERLAEVRAASRPLQRLSNLRAEDEIQLVQAAARSRQPLESMRYLPLRTRYATLTALVDGASGRFLFILPIDPRDG